MYGLQKNFDGDETKGESKKKDKKDKKDKKKKDKKDKKERKRLQKVDGGENAPDDDVQGTQITVPNPAVKDSGDGNWDDVNNEMQQPAVGERGETEPMNEDEEEAPKLGKRRGRITEDDEEPEGRTKR